MADISICCNTYNHGLYIRQALESFLAQETTYSFEILVYDDASTDNTVDIIREYEQRYPEIVKPIYQTTNQYSQGILTGYENRRRAKSKYIAICEGDDYWCDKSKLQKQIEYMEEHADCTFCFTNGFVQHGEILAKEVIPWDRTSIRKSNSNDYDAGELELLGYIPTASFIYRRELPFPVVSRDAFRGDTFIKLTMTMHGYAHFIEEPMVVYRRDVDSSVTAMWEKSTSAYESQCDKFIAMYDELNKISSYKYSDVFSMRICQWKIEKYYRTGNIHELKKLSVSGDLIALKRGNTYLHLNYIAKCLFPRITSFVKYIYRKASIR